MSPTNVEPARPQDREPILALLSECDLPGDGVADHLADFWVVRRDDELVAAVGIEDYGQNGLLRSLAVRPAARGRGLGARLARHALATARSRGMRAVYLLTLTAPDYFSRFAFRRVPRDSAPAALQASAEFAGACPDTAVCMRVDLDASASQT